MENLNNKSNNLSMFHLIIIKKKSIYVWMLFVR